MEKTHTLRSRIGGVMMFLAAFCAAILTLPSLIVIPVPVYVAGAEPTESSDDAYVDVDVDHARIIGGSPTFYDDFQNGSALTVVWDLVEDNSETDFVKSTGYLTSEVATATHCVAEWVNLTSDSALIECMVLMEDVETNDIVYMKIQGTDDSYVYVGLDDAVPQISYSNATGEQAWSNLSDDTVAEGEWTIWSIYLNSNSTIDCEVRWKTNFTVMHSAHLSSTTFANISAPSEVECLWWNNTGVAAKPENDYSVEYVFIYGNANAGEQPSDESAVFAPMTPETEKHIWKLMGNADVDMEDIIDSLTNSTTNCTGGTNVTTALDTWYTIPGNMDAALHNDTDSVYSKEDIADICRLTYEDNDSYEHREVYAYQIASNMEEDFKENLLDQFGDSDGDDDDSGYIVSYRIDAVTGHFIVSRDLAEAVEEAFWEGVDESSADVDPYATSVGDWIRGGMKGGPSDVSDATGDGLHNVGVNPLGLFGIFYDEGEDLVSKDGADIASDGYVMTHALIAVLIEQGRELIVDLADLIVTAGGNFMTNALSMVFAGTLGKIFWILVIIAVGIVAFFLHWRYGIFDPLLRRIGLKGRKATKVPAKN